MTYLLSLHASTRQNESFSNRILADFENQFFALHPQSDKVSRFLGEIPHLDFDAQQAGRLALEKHDERLRSAFALANELTDELLSASALVIATPMYNWGPPSSLKAWIDRVINTRTFYQSTDQLADLPVSVIISSGGLYSEGENAKHDFLRPWLLECFSRIGVRDLTFINCDPAGPMEYGRIDPSSSESGLSKALRQVPEAAKRARS
jgi:FMN-dependent NADH-azoreductase